MSPAFIKELLRKASLVAAREPSDELTVTDAHASAALDRPPPTTRASMGWLPGAHEVRPAG